MVTSLLYAMDKIANTVGHYDAYRKNGDLNKKLELCMLDLKSNTNNKNNKIFNEDSNELVRNLKLMLFTLIHQIIGNILMHITY